MPTTSGGLNFTYPNEGATGWYSTWVSMANVISAHDHSGAPNGPQLTASAFADNSITGAKIRLDNDEFLTARNNADSADINILKVNTSDAVEFAGGVTFAGALTGISNLTMTGNLTITGDVLDSNGNELIDLVTTSSAVNHVKVTNAATGNGATIEAAGDDTDVDLNINAQADGNIVLDGQKWPTADGSADEYLKTDGSGNLSWASVSASAGKVVQFKFDESTTESSTSSQITFDNTIPQISEGSEYITMSITPNDSSNYIIIMFTAQTGNSAGNSVAIALFKDSDADALQVTANTGIGSCTLWYGEEAGSTSSRTYRIRYGPSSSSNTAYMNNWRSASSWGLSNSATLIVMEVEETSP